MEAPDLPAEGDTIEQQIAFADPVQSQQAGEDDQNVDFAAERKERESGWGLEQAYVWGKVMRGRGYPAYFRPFEEVRGIPIRKVVAGGGYHWAALSINGQMYVCGQGEDGQLGLGATGPSRDLAEQVCHANQCRRRSDRCSDSGRGALSLGHIKL